MKYLWMEKIYKNEKLREILLAGVILILAVILLIILIVQPGNRKIASVDMERVLNAHPAMEEALSMFQAALFAMQQQLDRMPNEERVQHQQRMQEEISRIAMQLQNDAMDKVLMDIEKLAKQKGYSYVIDRNAIIIGGKDITDEILSALKQQKTEQEKVDVSEIPMIPVR